MSNKHNRFKLWTWLKLVYTYHTATQTYTFLGRSTRVPMSEAYTWHNFLFTAKLELLQKERGIEWLNKTTIVDALWTKV